MEANDIQISPVVIQLMKGILYKEEKAALWEALIRYEGPVRDYLFIIGLDLEIHDSDGFAYLRTKDSQEGETPLPRLVARRPLSYPVSLILALLRRKITEHEASSGDTRLILEVSELRDMVSAFFPSSSNEVKVQSRLDAHLKKIYDLGFIRFLDQKKEKIEVKRILKAFIDAQWLSEFDAKLSEYRGSEESEAEEEDNE
ncbi:MAG: DUF4194 domain-containing protein [Sphaerochaetaceae bacterium]|nr:DUF4194 domain-containing protein [Sphaerochaetaceae bacterium]